MQNIRCALPHTNDFVNTPASTYAMILSHFNVAKLCLVAHINLSWYASINNKAFFHLDVVVLWRAIFFVSRGELRGCFKVYFNKKAALLRLTKSATAHKKKHFYVSRLRKRQLRSLTSLLKPGLHRFGGSKELFSIIRLKSKSTAIQNFKSILYNIVAKLLHRNTIDILIQTFKLSVLRYIHV